jgi:putative ABC transport system substrate-binding protein
VAVLVSTGGDVSALAAKAATATIPIVSTFITDPVGSGLVASLNRPGGNVTGISLLTATLEAKRLGLLHDLLPLAATVGVLLNPNNPAAASQLSDMQEAARAIGLQLDVLRASTDREIDTAFESVAQHRIPALLVTSDAFFITRRDKLVALAERHAVPAMYNIREYAAAGGLMSYGIDLSDGYRQIGVYASRILKGTKPADLPVMQPTKFEFVINLKIAKALGLTIPAGLLSFVDEVIE